MTYLLIITAFSLWFASDENAQHGGDRYRAAIFGAFVGSIVAGCFGLIQMVIVMV